MLSKEQAEEENDSYKEEWMKSQGYYLIFSLKVWYVYANKIFW